MYDVRRQFSKLTVQFSPLRFEGPTPPYPPESIGSRVETHRWCSLLTWAPLMLVQLLKLLYIDTVILPISINFISLISMTSNVTYSYTSDATWWPYEIGTEYGSNSHYQHFRFRVRIPCPNFKLHCISIRLQSNVYQKRIYFKQMLN